MAKVDIQSEPDGQGEKPTEASVSLGKRLLSGLPNFTLPKSIGKNLMVAAGLALPMVPNLAIAADKSEVVESSTEIAEHLMRLADTPDMLFFYYKSLKEDKRNSIVFEKAVKKAAEKFPETVLDMENVRVYLGEPWARPLIKETFKFLVTKNLDQAAYAYLSLASAYGDLLPEGEALLEAQFPVDVVKNPFYAFKAGRVLLLLKRSWVSAGFEQAAKNAAKQEPVKFFKIVYDVCRGLDLKWYEGVLKESAERAESIDPGIVVRKSSIYIKYSWGPTLLEKASKDWEKKDPASAKAYISP